MPKLKDPPEDSDELLELDECNTSELLSRAQNGERAAVERVFLKVLPLLYRHAHGRLPRGARGHLDTSDVVHDAIAAILPRLEQFDPGAPEAFKAYAKKVARNRVIDEARRVKREGFPEPAESFPLASNEMSPAERLALQEDYERYLRAFERLKEDERELIAARFHLGLSYREVAVASGKRSEDAARMALKRTLARLAKMISKERS